MYIRTLECKNFRNYEELSIELDPGINLLYGDNGQGKTNILEAVYICAASKSHRSSKDRDLIRFGSEEAHIRLTGEKKEVLHKIDIHFKKSRKKGIAVDGVPIKKASELLGLINVVFFSPEDLSIVKSGPSERRRFLDKEICLFDPLYVSSLFAYNRALEQRNKLLKDIAFQESLLDTLDLWDEQIIRYGKEVISCRRNFLSKLQEICEGIHENLSNGEEKLKLSYEPDKEEDLLLKALAENRQRDLYTQQTNAGPHRDDFSLSVNGIDLRTFGSQGQQKSAAISLKLGEIEILNRLNHEMPLLLLDDVLSELDSKRQESLLKEIKKTQTIITGTGLDEFIRNDIRINRKFYIEKGRALLR